MKAYQAKDYLQGLLDFEIDTNSETEIEWVKTFEEAKVSRYIKEPSNFEDNKGAYTSRFRDGLVVRMTDGSEFQVRIRPNNPDYTTYNT